MTFLCRVGNKASVLLTLIVQEEAVMISLLKINLFS